MGNELQYQLPVTRALRSIRHLLLVLIICAFEPAARAGAVAVGGAKAAASTTQACSTSVRLNGTEHQFERCEDLGVQGAAIAWTLGAGTGVLEVGFTGQLAATGGWVGWGLNPSGPRMVGASAFVAFSAPNGTTLLPYKLTAPATLGGGPLACSPIDYVVLSSAVQISGADVAMILTLQLDPNASRTLNHVWNRGPSVTSFQPAPHSTQPDDLKAVAQIDMSAPSSSSSSSSAVTPVGLPTQAFRNRHAILNTLGWGFLLPVGVMMARYMRPFADPMWFYLHITLQSMGYALGVSGWVTGLEMQRAAGQVVFHKHSNIGMALFALSTLQIMALFLRPRKQHKLRLAWNVYHHSVGYSVIILGLLNVFLGFGILMPPLIWRHAYICTLAALAGITFLLEAVTWTSFFSSRWKKSSHPHEEEEKQTYIGATGTFGPTQHVLRVI